MLEAANRIESRERLARIIDGQVASGQVKKGSARRHLSHLRSAAYGRGQDVSLGGLSAFGIKVERRG